MKNGTKPLLESLTSSDRTETVLDMLGAQQSSHFSAERMEVTQGSDVDFPVL